MKAAVSPKGLVRKMCTNSSTQNIFLPLGALFHLEGAAVTPSQLVLTRFDVLSRHLFSHGVQMVQMF